MSAATKYGFWMVRAGEGGRLFEVFRERDCVAIGFADAGDFTDTTTWEGVRARIEQSYQDHRSSTVGLLAAMVHKFRNLMQVGDRVVTYDPSSRNYWLGTISGEYRYEPGYVQDYSNVRPVQWNCSVSRDALNTSSKNTLGSTLTLFEPGDEVLADLLQAAQEQGDAATEEEPVESDLELLRQDVVGKAHEFIKDRLIALAPADVEKLLAALLRAMGYRARVTATGADGGRDVVASPDGLGLQQPRIIGEVKHRKAPTSAPDLRAFIGGLRQADQGLYLSTGGFSKEARYEADRASIPVALVDLDELASLVVEHYDAFDTEGRALFPLTRVYWPVG